MIRRASAEDATQLLHLMHRLAVFEGYSEKFAVTHEDIIERGFSIHRAAEFAAWVAQGDAGVLAGYAIVYAIPFTFDLRPTIVLKELFVEESQRGQRYGHELFATVVHYAHSLHARLIRWQVLPSNHAAKRFYRRLGGECDTGWENWLIDLDSVRPAKIRATAK